MNANIKQDLETYEQLRLAIGDDDLADDEGTITPAEARARAEAARKALEALPNPPAPFPKGKGEEFSPVLRAGEGNTPPSNLPPNSTNLEGDNSEMPWLEEYYELVDKGWKWRLAAYIAWAASPKKGRWPATQMELARLIGLTSDRTIIAARKRNLAIDQTITVMQAAPLMAHRRDVMEALVESAQIVGRNGNPDRKMYLEMTGDYKRTVKIEEGEALADERNNMSADELEKRAESLKQQREKILKTAEEEEGDGA